MLGDRLLSELVLHTWCIGAVEESKGTYRYEDTLYSKTAASICLVSTESCENDNQIRCGESKKTQLHRNERKVESALSIFRLLKLISNTSLHSALLSVKEWYCLSKEQRRDDVA